MRVFWESTTGQMIIFILCIAGLAAGFTDDITWLHWLDSSIYCLGIYAGKEGVGKVSTAYREKADK